MERIKRFYKEHKTACNTVIAGLAIGLVTARRVNHGNRIDDVSLWTRTDGAQMVVARRENGKTENFWHSAPTEV